VITLTHTTATQFRNCRRRWWYRNVKRLVPRYAGEARGIGYAVHKGIELGDVEAGVAALGDRPVFDQEDYDQLELARATVRAMLTGYFRRFEPLPNYRAEQKFNISIINPKTRRPSRTFRLAGRVDGLCTIGGQEFLVEYKTVSQLGPAQIGLLPMDGQVTAYMYALQRALGIRIAGAVYRFLRKPSIRRRQGETAEQFRERLVSDYLERPDWYFREELVYRSQEDLDRFEQELWDLTQDMLHARRRGLYYRNTSRCYDYGGCEYLPLCRGDHEAELFFVTEPPNSELREGDDVGEAHPA